MRVRTAMATAVLLALTGLGGAACGGGGSEPLAGGVAGAETTKAAKPAPERWATSAELDWLRALATWNAAIEEAAKEVAAIEADPVRLASVAAGEPEARDEYVRSLQPIRDCGESFDEVVHEAPSERLAAPEESYRAACEHYRTAIDLLLDGFEKGDDGLVQRAQYRVVEARKEMQVAEGTLPPGEKQELPERGGTADVSRVEPRFSAAVSAVVEKEIEARCWSRDDWRKLLVEEKIHSRGKIDEDVLGFAATGGKRINLSPTICEPLARLTYRAARPQSPEQRLQLALALVTLVHEGIHAGGVADEPTAECHAIQLSDRTALELGVPPAYARALKATYWQAYPSLPATYRSEECRRGGALDLGVGDRFP